MITIAADVPPAGLNLAVSGHRSSHPAMAANGAAIAAAIERVFDLIQAEVIAARPPGGTAPTRLHCLLSDGVDQMAAVAAQARGWTLVAPLPFGRTLNLAVNAQPATVEDAQALLSGQPPTDPVVRARAESLRAHAEAAQAFELAEQDGPLRRHFIHALEREDRTPNGFAVRASERVALAAHVMLEQADLLVTVWDGSTELPVGGTGHTVNAALALGAGVVWIDAARPERVRVLRTPEALGAPAEDEDMFPAALAGMVRQALSLGTTGEGGEPEQPWAVERWRPRSHPLAQIYRRIEALFDEDGRGFGPMRQTYERPDGIAAGSAAGVLARARALPGADPAFAERLESMVLQPFAWFDGVATFLSDCYRSGMILGFLFAGLAVVAGLAYQPLGRHDKWAFAATEFLLLAAILAITWTGQRRRWHGRWFETRRVAEYLRHAPTNLLMGVARPPGRWPRGVHTSWPEAFARHRLRSVGLPQVAVTDGYLRGALEALLNEHVVPQLAYHQAKARRLARVHRRLDRISETLFLLAVAWVVFYLAAYGGGRLGLWQSEWIEEASEVFTFFGVMFPTFGGAVAGIRYFGDFERFSAISEVTAEKLQAVAARTRLLLTVPDEALDYGRAAELARLVDEIVFSEIENWQAVFGGKHITVPV